MRETPFDTRTVLAAANMPPTPGQTQILAPGILRGGAGTAHLAHAPPAIHPGIHVREAAPPFAAASKIWVLRRGSVPTP
jgi:hypothetical protein